MSYQRKSYGWITVCDICQEFGPIGDRYIRAMPHSTADEPRHLCNCCRSQAVWCEAHNVYHLGESFHRHACSDCGGLFTSVARAQLRQCPSCRPAMVPTATAPQVPTERRFLASVSSWLAQALHM